MSEYKSVQQQIIHLQNQLEMVSRIMSFQKQSEDVVIFIGPSKNGKSTLINYFLGNELEAEFDKRLFITHVKKTFEEEGGPDIGAGIHSETTVPSRWDNAPYLPGLVLWDAPGFGDNRGPIQDIINACFIYQIFQLSKTLKIVLVLDFSELCTNGMIPLLSLLNNVEKLLSSAMPSCYASIVLAINKVPESWLSNPVDVALICEILKARFLESELISISKVCRDFVQHLIENQQQIGLFKMANTGPLSIDIDLGVTESILNVKSISSDALRGLVCPSLDHKSQVFLFKAQEHVLPRESFKNLCELAEKVCIEKLKSCKMLENRSDKYKLKEAANKLATLSSDIKRILRKDNNLERMIHLLMNVDKRIEDKISQEYFHEKSKLMVLIDKLLGMKCSMGYTIAMQIAIKAFLVKVETAIIAVDRKLEKISNIEYEQKIQKLTIDKEQEIKKLRIELEMIEEERNKLFCELNKREKCTIL